MASEILSVPEEYLPFVISVIRAGLEIVKTKNVKEAREALKLWCDEEARYLDRLKRDE